MSDVWKESEFSEFENSAGCAGPEVQPEVGWGCILLVYKDFFPTAVSCFMIIAFEMIS
jgi:hypothetical protein